MIPGVILHKEFYDGIKELTDEQAGMFVKSALKFAFDGVSPDFNDVTLKVLWSVLKCRISEDITKYETISEKRREAADKRWKKTDANASSEMQMHTNASTCNAKNANASTKLNETKLNITNLSDKREEIQKQINNKNKHRFGGFSNVILTQEEYDEWLKQCPKAEFYIERLSEYIENTGKKYANHLATMRKWWLDDKTKESVRSYDLDEHTQRALSQPLVYKKKI